MADRFLKRDAILDKAIDRRTFIRTAAISGMTMGLGITLTGCADDAPKSQTANEVSDDLAVEKSSSSNTAETASASSIVYFTPEMWHSPLRMESISRRIMWGKHFLTLIP